MKRLITLIFVIFFEINSNAQIIDQLYEPEIGRPFPQFVFDQIIFYKKKSASINDFKGKWLILDFWAKNCSSCISNFPVINDEQQKFSDSVQFLMVTYNDDEHQHKPLYTKYHDKLHLSMPCAFLDSSVIYEHFNVGLLPHAIIIDPQGIVRVRTVKVSQEKLSALLEGKNPVFTTASYDDGKQNKNKFSYNPRLPFLEYGNGGIDSIFLYRSLLSKWSPNVPQASNEQLIHSDRENKVFNDKGRFEGLGLDLSILYRLAYFGRLSNYFDRDTNQLGKCWPNPILEIRDSSLFRYDYATGENIFCYSLIVPPDKATSDYMMTIMRNDLKNYFGFNVIIETRSMPYWKLVATDKAKIKLRSKGGPVICTDNGKPWQELSFRNFEMSRFIVSVETYSGVTYNGTPLIDETGIIDKIDIDVDWLKNDLNSVQEALKKNGLELVKSEKDMKCIILRDPK